MTAPSRERMRHWLAWSLLLATAPAAAAAPAADTRSEVVVAALALIGTPYKVGGATPAGFDCSGFVWHVFKATWNIELPRRAEDMSRLGQPVERGEVQPGDLVYFNTLRRAYSHVAIYIGGGRFVHAPAHGGHVRTESFTERYWQSRYNGARRVGGRSDAVAAPPLLPGLAEDLDTVRP